MDLANKRVLVVGLGKSGVASALVFAGARRAGHGFRREAARPTWPGNSVLLDHGIAVETGGHGERTFRGQDLIVVSPGVPVDSPPLVQARALGESVIGEIELASLFLPKNIVAITGSNGKTTTTTLAGEIVAGGGFPERSGATSARRRSLWLSRRKPTPSWCWKCRVFNWKPFKHFVRKLPWCSTSRPITLTGIARLPHTPTPKRAFSRISRQTITPS